MCWCKKKKKRFPITAFHSCLKYLAYRKQPRSTPIADEAIAQFLFQSSSPYEDNSGIKVLLLQNKYAASNMGNLFHGN